MARSSAPPGAGKAVSAAHTPDVAVIELDDVVARRVLDRPNVLVVSTIDAAGKVESLRSGRGGPAWARGHVRRLRPDLADAGESKAEAERRLAAAGYTVNRDQALWRVYVIELSPAPEGVAGWVYVGETSKDVDERVEQHRAAATRKNGTGRLNSAVVTKHFVCRRPDLEPLSLVTSRSLGG